MNSILAGILSGVAGGAQSKIEDYKNEINQRRLENIERLKQKFVLELQDNQVANREYLAGIEHGYRLEEQEQQNQLALDRLALQDKDARERLKIQKQYQLDNLKAKFEYDKKLKSLAAPDKLNKELFDRYKAKAESNKMLKQQGLKVYNDLKKNYMMSNGKMQPIPPMDKFMQDYTGRKDWQQMDDPNHLMVIDQMAKDDPNKVILITTPKWMIPLDDIGILKREDLETIKQLRFDPDEIRLKRYDELDDDTQKKINSIIESRVKEAQKSGIDNDIIEASLNDAIRFGHIGGPDIDKIINSFYKNWDKNRDKLKVKGKKVKTVKTPQRTIRGEVYFGDVIGESDEKGIMDYYRDFVNYLNYLPPPQKNP